MMRTKEQILTDLFMCFIDICDTNIIKYSLVDELAQYVMKEMKFPDSFNRIIVAMTTGDIERLIKAVEDLKFEDGIEIKYIKNDNYTTTFNYHFCNNRTTVLSIRDTHRYNYVYITIIEIEKFNNSNESNRYKNILKYCNGRNFTMYDGMEFLRSIIWKIRKWKKGNEEFIDELYNNRNRRLGIKTWDDIFIEKQVVVSKKSIPTHLLLNGKYIYYNGREICIVPYFASDVFCGKYPLLKRKYVEDIVLDMSVDEFERGSFREIKKDYYKAKHNYKVYLRQYKRTRKDRKEIAKMHKTFLMSVDVKSDETLFLNLSVDSNVGTGADTIEKVNEALEKYSANKEYYQSIGIKYYENAYAEKLLENWKNS